MCAVARRAAEIATVVVVLAIATGCGRIAPEPTRHVQPRPSSVPAPSATDDGAGEVETPGPGPTEPFPQLPPLPPPEVPAPQPGATASACGGSPSVRQVVAALRRDRDILPAGVTPTASTGPLCAATWQYTVLSLPGREPLQVVTRGSPGSLTVVTAGTYVCSSAVTDAAPPGILTAARCR
jgi:hypothetical protein